MKAIIFSIFIVALVGCKSSKNDTKPHMPGVYSMQSQTIDDGKDKTVLKDLKQLKIYTDKYYMYVQYNPSSSVYSFGLGSYAVNDSGKVIETSIYTAGDTAFTTDQNKYNLDITTSIDGYKQFIPEIIIGGQKSTLTEEYTRSGTDVTTPLDGVWKESNFYVVNGNDTTAHERTQYKSFYHGYFMYGQYNLNDSTNTHSTGMGFGTFKMENDHQIKETDLNSSFNIVPGQVYTIDIEMINENSYKQTLTQPDGSKHIEIYQRFKS